ncbi:MAG: response regulator transcription factor [Chloroflexota bacterium]
MTRVLVSAPSAVVRAGLETIVNDSGRLEAIGGRSGNLAQQVELVEPDVILLELERGSEGLVPLLLSFGGSNGSTPIVLLLDHDDGESTAEALRLGARAVLPHDALPEEIVAAVEAVAAGLVALHPDTIYALVPARPPTSRSDSTVETEALTPREVEVLAMLSEGEGNKLIARRLGISEHTVKFHVGSILAKLNASSRTEAVTVGVRQGLIML